MTYFKHFKQDHHADATANLVPKPDRTEFRDLNMCVHIHFNHHKNGMEMRDGRDLKNAGHSGISKPNPLPLLPSSLQCKSPPT